MKEKFRTKFILNAVLILLLLSSISCSPLHSDKLTGDSYIAVLSDVHISSSEGKDNRLKEFVKKVNSRELNVDAVIVTGDCVSTVFAGETPEEHTTENNRLLRFNTMMSKLEVPYFFVMGNHDYKIDQSKDSDDPFTYEQILGMEKIWKDVTGFEAFHSAEVNGWKYIFLSSMRGRYLERAFDDEQLDWFAKELETDKPVLVFSHHPIDTDNFRMWCKSKDLITSEKEPKLFNILSAHKSKIKGYFVGHGHMWVSDKLYDTISVYETNSFGDSDDYTFSIIGLDNESQNISVKKFGDVKKEELKIK